MKRISLLILLNCLCYFSHAQTAASYGFTSTTGAYSALTGATAAGGVLADDATQTSIPIGFTFVFCGNSCTTLSACSNGWLSFANSSSIQRVNSAANVVSSGFLMPFWDDLVGTSGTSTASYKTTGTAPNRVFTFEWKAWQEFATTYVFFIPIASAANNVSMQVKLYESTNVIEFCYGSGPTLGTSTGSTFFGTLVTTAGTIGIANSTTDYQTLNAASASPTASSASFTTSLGNAPPANTLYRWTPACALTTTASSNSAICSGNTLSLADAVTGTATGYLWSGPAGFSSTQQNPSINNAPVSRAGVYSVTTSSASCTVTATTTVVIDSTPVATIAGATAMCSGGSTTITFTGTAGATVSYNINGGGTLTAVIGATGTVNVNTGVLTTGASASTYTYNLVSVALGSCSQTLTGSAVVTINPFPTAITGIQSVCEGGFTTTLFNATTPGTWSSGSPLIASVNTSTGVVTGLTSGNANITYTLTSTGCAAVAVVTVNPTPSPITGTTAVCEAGGITTLSDPSGTGTWASQNPAIATVTSPGGIVTGLTPGSSIITFTLPTGCYTTTTVTVGTALGPITGAASVCQGGVTTLTPPVGGGSWACNPGATASVSTSGVVNGNAAGNAIVTYSMPSGCSVARIVTVNPLPVAISGTPVVCQGLSTTLSDLTSGGTWSSANTGIATINPSSGLMTGVAAGNTLIVYTLTSTSCTANIPVTVNPLPAPVNGPTFTVCAGGATISLGSATSGGTWSSGATPVATATGAASGIITGVSAGTAPITYTITSTGCIATADVTVLPTPAAITGTASVCEAGSITTLADATTPGTWSISAGGFATISPSGTVTGNTAGFPVITYTGSNNCFATTVLTVNPLPAALTGTFSVCQASVTTLSSTSTGGSWISGSPFIASVSSGGGVGGILPGTSIITYTLPTGCRTTQPVVVNAIPGPVLGDNYVCIGHTTALSNIVGGGIWSSNPTSVATIDASGIVYGTTLGTFDVTYTTGTNGCFTTQSMTVNPIVGAGMSLIVNPGTTVCAGTPVTFTANPSNAGSSPLYVWSVNNVILSGASSYTYTPVNGDLVRCWIISSYSCAMPDTASAWVYMVVNPNVTPGLSITTGMGDTICQGNSVNLSAVPVNGGTAPVYQWFVNTAFVGAGSSYSYTPANGDLIYCNMISNVPCPVGSITVNASKILTVSPFVAPVVNMYSALGPTACEGYPVVYTATQLNGGWSPAFQWSVNGSPTVTGPSYTYTPANTDLVAVTLTSSFPCAVPTTATTNMLMTVVPIVAAVGTIDVAPGYIVMTGTPVTFTANITSGGGLAPTFQWLRNAIPIPGATNTTYTTSTLNDGDSISLQVVNTDLCSGITTFTAVKMNVGNNVGVQNVGISGSIALVPNPNKGSFTIKGSVGTIANQEVIVEITDMVGQVVYSSKLNARNGQLDEHISLSNTLANGMYLLTLKSQNANSVFHFVLEQ